MHHTLDIASVAAARGIPYVMTLHDYYTVCPSYTLLDPDGRPCGACLDPGHRGTPEPCLKALGQPASYLHDYQQAMGAFLRGAARLFVPNIRVRDIVSARYPELRDTMAVIEHGHRPAPDGPRARRPIERDGRARLDVAVIGALDVHKGSSVLRDLLRANRRRETTFHLYGTAPDPDLTPAERDRGGRLDGSHFVYHGPYESTEIVRRLVADGIHVGLQLAVWPETFSYTVSEFVEAGIPVIAGDLGAQGERIRRCRLGWTVADLREPGAVLAILDGILRDPAALDAMAIGMRRDEALIPIETMWRRYGQAYEEIITRGGPSMTREAEPGADAAPSRRYLATLAMSVAEAESRETRLRQRAEEAEAQLQAVRQRLRSPRHRIADAIGDAIQRIPVVWPLLARLTEAVLRREERRGRPGVAPFTYSNADLTALKTLAMKNRTYFGPGGSGSTDAQGKAVAGTYSGGVARHGAPAPYYSRRLPARPSVAWTACGTARSRASCSSPAPPARRFPTARTSRRRIATTRGSWRRRSIAWPRRPATIRPGTPSR